MAVTRQQVAELYVATFNRAPDADGLDYWVNLSGLSIEGIASSFFDQAETQALYPTGTTDTVFVTSIYTNLFNRAPDAAGLAYWEAELTSGNMTRSVMIEAMKNGALGADALIIANKATVGLAYADAGLQGTDFSLASVTAYQSSVTAALAEVDNIVDYGDTGTTFTLTTGIDSITGTIANDTFNANYNATATAHTLGGLDVLNGGAGNDTLAITSDSGALYTLSGATISNIETITIRGDNAVTAAVNGSNVTGLDTLNVTQAAGAVSLTAASTTDVNVSGVVHATATIAVIGGETVTINHKLDSAGDSIAVNAAGNVNVTATDVIDAAGINIGTTTVNTGTVVVTSTGAAYTATTANTTLDAIAVTGGTTITVNQIATSSSSVAATDTTNTTITQGAVTIVAGTTTTEVVINQDTAVQVLNATTAVTGTATTQEVTFVAMTAGQTASLGMGAGIITFTAKKALTAAEAASAFANLIAGDDQGNASATLGLYSDNSLNTTADTWASASVVAVDATHSKVVFSTSLSTETAIAENGATVGVDTVGAVVAGIDAVTGVTGNMGIVAGAVSVTANATDVLTSITLDSYGTGSTTTATTSLATLNLSNVAEAVTLVVADTASTLALTLENVGYDLNLDATIGDAVLTFTAAPTTLNVTSTGNNYVNLTAAATTTLNVSGTGTLDADATDLAVLATVTVSGTAGLKLNSAVSNTVTSVNTSATTGATTVTIDGAVATYTGGAGVDTVTLATSTALTKAIDLGAGDDTLSFAALNVTGSTATLSGGEGTDTLSMATATAAALDATAQTFYTNFERLTLNDSGLTGTDINLENLGFVNYVKTTGNAGTLTLSNLANNGTVVLGAAATATVVSVKDATTGLTDVLNVVANAATGVNLGTLTADQVETINVTVNDTDTTSTAGVENVSTNTMVLDADKATSVDLGGAGNLVLTVSAATTELATINASDMTGALNVTTLAGDTGATTVTGGSAADTITLSGANDVAIGGAGNDTLIVTGSASAVTLTGGTGDDSFDVSAFTAANAGSAVTITDIAAGEQIIFKNGLDGMNFASGQVTLIAEATFTEYVVEAAARAELATETFYDATVGANTYEGGIAWFQFNSNTFIVQDVDGDGVFTDGADIIVKLNGLVDLSTASFNTTNGSLEII